MSSDRLKALYLGLNVENGVTALTPRYYHVKNVLHVSKGVKQWKEGPKEGNLPRSITDPWMKWKKNVGSLKKKHWLTQMRVQWTYVAYSGSTRYFFTSRYLRNGRRVPGRMDSFTETSHSDWITVKTHRGLFSHCETRLMRTFLRNFWMCSLIQWHLHRRKEKKSEKLWESFFHRFPQWRALARARSLSDDACVCVYMRVCIIPALNGSPVSEESQWRHAR